MSQSTRTIGPDRTYLAVADYSLKQFYIMKQSSATEVTIASAATDFIVGTVVNKPAPAAGANVEIAMRTGGGTARVILGGTVTTVGDKLTADSAGKAVVTTTGADQILGYALQTGSAGDIIEYAPTWGLVR